MLWIDVEHQQNILHRIHDADADVFATESEDCAAAVPRGNQHERAPNKRRVLAAIQDLLYAAVLIRARLDGFEAFGARATCTFPH